MKFTAPILICAFITTLPLSSDAPVAKHRHKMPPLPVKPVTPVRPTKLVPLKQLRPAIVATNVSTVVTNPYNITLSLIAYKFNAGYLWSTGGIESLTIQSLNTPLLPGSTAIEGRRAPAPLPLTWSKYAGLGHGPTLSIGRSLWNSTSAVAVVDMMNLTAGKTYQLQYSWDRQNWHNSLTVAWTQTSTNYYWRVARAVPANTNFYEFYRCAQLP